jgi:glycerol-3-phosphate cytidylyltransferase
MKTIGFTAGVFDMFHIGHLNFIENAKRQCDYLIIGVNSDELVVTYKQKGVVVPFEERIRIIAALKIVDQTIKIDTLDKEAVWRENKFDFLFIGDDWRGNPRWTETERVMLAHGVRTVYLPYTHATTSTLLRNKLDNCL